MVLCKFGCGQEAKYKSKDGSYMCSKSPNQCPAMIEKNKIAHKKIQYKKCPYCGKQISCNIGGQYTKHINSCIYKEKKKTIFKAFGNINEDIARWTKWYNNIIKNRIENPLIGGYKEKHHILPKSMGGSNEANNLVYLTAKEHYICHLLLVRITQNDKVAYKKMLSALFKLAGGNNNKYYSSNTYKIYREEYVKSLIGHHNQDGEKNSAYGKKWISDLEHKISKMVPKDQVESFLLAGWVLGNKVWIRLEKKEEQNKKIKENKEKLLEKQRKDLQLYEKYYNIYRKYGWNEFKKITNYPYSRANLVVRIRRLLKKGPPFVDSKPKNCNKSIGV